MPNAIVKRHLTPTGMQLHFSCGCVAKLERDPKRESSEQERVTGRVISQTCCEEHIEMWAAARRAA